VARFVDPAVAAERRRAIGIGLQAALGQDDTENALLLWDTGYAEIKPHAVADFVEAVATQFKLGSNERLKLRMSVMHAVLTSLQSRPAAANGSLNGASRPVAAPATPQPAPRPDMNPQPGVSVFVHMAERMLAGVRRHGGAVHRNFLDALRQQLNHAESPLPLQLPALMRWATDLAPVPAFGGYSDHGLAHLLHLIYVSAAQTLGPVAADTLLTQAVVQAEQLPEAARFPPRRLL
jgi:hypothetical protein